MGKYQYAPGGPGYGLKGTDGSSGLLGFSMYGSDYNAASNATILNNRISSNFDLYSTGGNLIPGYPNRIYQTGDLLIDADGDIYEIDLTGSPNKFIATGISFTIADFFTYTGLNDAGYERWSNKTAGVSDPKLIDIVYSSTIAAYSTYPTEIYGNDPLDYGQIFYNDQTPVNDYEPYTIWISGDAETNDRNAIALVRDSANNIYRLGNLSTTNAQRATHLALDFTSITGDFTFNGITFTEGNIARIKFDGSSGISGWPLIIQGDDATGQHGGDITVKGGNGFFYGGDVSISAGYSYGTGGFKGGNIYLNAGRTIGVGSATLIGPGVYVGNSDTSVVVVKATDVSILCKHLTVDGSIIFNGGGGATGTDASTFWLDISINNIIARIIT